MTLKPPHIKEQCEKERTNAVIIMFKINAPLIIKCFLKFWYRNSRIPKTKSKIPYRDPPKGLGDDREF